MVNLLITIVVGAIVGWVAGIIMKDQGSLLRNIIIGVLAGALSGWLLAPRNLILGLACDVAVACLLIFLAKKIFK